MEVMCLGVPGEVIELQDDPQGLALGKVSFGGVIKEVCLAYVPEARVGDYVIVHVGFAISKIDKVEAHRVFELLREIDGATELGTPPDRDADPQPPPGSEG
jgi:hydrogenase expression/formation protein HypC